jgi:hypothetical protein
MLRYIECHGFLLLFLPYEVTTYFRTGPVIVEVDDMLNWQAAQKRATYQYED